MSKDKMKKLIDDDKIKIGATMQDLHSADEMIEQVNEAIKRGERVKVYFETIMEIIGWDYGNPSGEFWRKLNEVQDDYEEACNKMALLAMEAGKNRQPKEGVSVSN